MKYLIILVLVLVVAWLWRSAREQKLKSQSAQKSNSHQPQEMVICGHCGVHLPAQDAVAGREGLYCDARHRAAVER